MPPPNISSFTCNLLALRKKAHEFKLIEWIPEDSKWVSFETFGTLSTAELSFRTHQSPYAQCVIRYKRCERLCYTSSLCIVYGDTKIPVIYADKKYPASYYDNSIVLHTLSDAPLLITTPLWNLAPTYVPAPAPVPAPTVPSKHPSSVKVPLFAAQLLISDAVKREEVCPITYNTITLESASITNCFHIFDTEAIQHSLRLNPSCPTCRHAAPVTTECV